MVNKGNCLMAHEKYAEAVEFYHEALAVDSGCFEALYNLGTMGLLEYKEQPNLLLGYRSDPSANGVT
jgi:tetratricopeptide (TPR) repeat protein